jgi:hypothetical protein
MHLSGVLYLKILRNSYDALQDQKIIYVIYLFTVQNAQSPRLKGGPCKKRPLFDTVFVPEPPPGRGIYVASPGESGGCRTTVSIDCLRPHSWAGDAASAPSLTLPREQERELGETGRRVARRGRAAPLSLQD